MPWLPITAFLPGPASRLFRVSTRTRRGQYDDTIPRDRAIAAAWTRLGSDVATLGNASGRPLARTVKLILDPLVLRPAENPHLARRRIGHDDAAELSRRIAEAAPQLRGAAAWYPLLKKARRARGITEGNPQELYFQRCYELAHLHGMPGPDAERLALETVEEIRDTVGEKTVSELRRFVTDPEGAAELEALLDAAWQHRTGDRRPATPMDAPRPAQPTDRAPESLTEKLDGYLRTLEPPNADRHAFDRLLAEEVGTRASLVLDEPGVARDYGLTDHELPPRPRLGHHASKRELPKPFDRSVLERLFAAFTTVQHRETMAAVPQLVRDEIARSGRAWQLEDERCRLTLALGRAASAGLGPDHGPVPDTPTHRRLRARWEREAYVRRVRRLGGAEPSSVSDDPADPGPEVRTVRQAYLRRLWARLHGRELRGERVVADEVWELLDGVLRSVIMDHRDRLRRRLERTLDPDPGEAA